MFDLRKFLMLNGLKQKELAEYLGVTQSRVSHYVKNESVPMEKLDLLLNNNKGWNTNPIKIVNDQVKLDEQPDERQDDQLEIQVDDISGFIRDVIKDYQQRLTEKDATIKELMNSVTAQNQILTGIVEKLLDERIFTK